MATTQAPSLEGLVYTSGQNLSAHELAMMQPQPQPNPHQHLQPMVGAPSQLYYQNNPIYHRQHHQYPSEPPQASTNNNYYMGSGSHFVAQQQTNYTAVAAGSGPQTLPGYCVGGIDPPQEHYLNPQINLGHMIAHQEQPTATNQETLDADNQLPGFESHYFAPPPVPHHHQQHETAGAVFFQMASAGSQAPLLHQHSEQFQPWIGSSTTYPVSTTAHPPHHSNHISEERNRQPCGGAASIYHLPTISNNAGRQSATSNHQSATNTQVRGSRNLKSLASSTDLESKTATNLKAHQRSQMTFGVTARRKNATRETTANLKSWLEEHGHNPYPSKGEKIMLAMVSRLSMTQVSTWFANARRRMKKENRMLSWALQRPPATSSSSSTTTHLNTQVEEHGGRVPAVVQQHQQSSRSRALKYLMNRHYLGSGLALSQAYSASKQDHRVSSCQAFGGSVATGGGKALRPEKLVRQAQSSEGAVHDSSSRSRISIATTSTAESSLRAPKWNTGRHRKRALRASTDSDGAPSTTTAAC